MTEQKAGATLSVAGNRTHRDDLANPAFGELYAYDGLGQLTGSQRGTLNAARDGLSGAASRTLAWDHDALGNFRGVEVDGASTARAHNARNEVTGVGPASLQYDANGNLTRDEAGRRFSYDAWNRLTSVVDAAGNFAQYNWYDGLGSVGRSWVS